LCAADAAPGLIEMKSGLAVIDYTKTELADPSAGASCPTGAIVWVEGAQFAEDAKPTPTDAFATRPEMAGSEVA
jgi:hypothetical protein